MQGDNGRLKVYLQDESSIFDLLTTETESQSSRRHDAGSVLVVSIRVKNASLITRDFYSLRVSICAVHSLIEA